MNYRLLAYLNNELHGIWIDKEEERINLHVKTSVPIIKSIWSGAPIQLVIGKLTEKNILVLGLIIEDNERNPYVLAYPPRESAEVSGLEDFLLHNYNAIHLSFYDAHTLKVMDMKINADDSHLAHVLFHELNFISGYKEANESLDNFFDNAISDNECIKGKQMIRIPMSVVEKKAYLSTVHEPNDTDLTYDISFSKNGSEGYDQEAFVYHALRQIFSSEEAFHSPDIIEGNKEREFVDILISEGDCVLSIQSKASSLVEMGLKTHGKLCSIYKKKALQGLEQVKGIVPILKGDVVINNSGNERKIKKKDNVYHLVIISDLVLDDDGAQDIFNEIHRLYNEKHAKTLVMSVEGVVNFVKISRLHKKLFWANLETKFQFSLKNKTILIHDIDSSQERNLPLIASEKYISFLRGEG